jgi:acyl dehydratase
MTPETNPSTIVFGPVTRAMLALYAGASGDHNPIHIDSDFAKASGQPDVFAHGMLSFGVLARVATEWAGQSRLRRFGVRFASITRLHDLVTASGTVVERFDDDGQPCIRLAVEARTQDGRLTLAGEAIIEDR